MSIEPDFTSSGLALDENNEQEERASIMWRSGVGRALRSHALRATSTRDDASARFAVPAAVAATAAAAALAWTLADTPATHAHTAAKDAASTLHLPPPVASSGGSANANSSDNPTANATALEKMRLTRRFTRRRLKRSHTFVIVGSGTAAHAAIEAIRQEDPQADILVLSDETALPRMDTDPYKGGDDDESESSEQIAEPLMETYNEWRRHLTAKLEDEPSEAPSHAGSGSTSAAAFPPPLTLLLDKKAMRFDVEKNRIYLGDGTEIRYSKCLIASSGKPRHFYVLDRHRISYSLKDRINLCTTLSDFSQLDQLHKRADVASVLVIGGGFLGTEVATALATDPRNAHIRTQLIFTESAPTSRSLPLYLADELALRLARVGVTVVPDHLVTSLKCSDNDDDASDVDGDASCARVVVEGLGQGSKTHTAADFVVLASTHTDPNLRFGRDTCFEIDEVNGGIMVNAQLEAISGLFVAGNAASYFDPYLGRRRVDRYDHAVNSGLVAGRNMVASLAPATGKMKNYRHQPMFRSNLRGIDVVIEGVGEIDASLRTVGVWVQPPRSSHTRPTQQQHHHHHASTTPPESFDRGVVYYLKGNKIMGILLWNASDVLDSAKQLLLSRPEIHDNVVDELQHVISIAPTDWLHVVTT